MGNGGTGAGDCVRLLECDVGVPFDCRVGGGAAELFPLLVRRLRPSPPPDRELPADEFTLEADTLRSRA